MPKRVFNLLLLADEEEFDDVERFLSEVVGMGEPGRSPAVGGGNTMVVPMWPSRVDTHRSVLGQGPCTIELKAIPEAVRGTVSPGVAVITFATPDVEGYAKRAATAGFEVGEVVQTGGITQVRVEVGGQGYVFARFPD